MSLISSPLPSYLQKTPTKRAGGNVGFFSNSRSSLREIEDDDDDRLPPRPPSPAPDAMAFFTEEKVYVALERDFKLGKANLTWVLKNTPRTKKIVIVHVHVPAPAQTAAFMGAWFPTDQVKKQEVGTYKEIERKKVDRALNEYVEKCASVKEMQAEKLVIEANDVGQGLLDLIAHYKITNLVMGAAADKNYSKRLKEPRSKKAITVLQQVDLSCKIWFLCKGNLICTREDLSGTWHSSGPNFSQSGRMTPPKSPSRGVGQIFNFFPSTSQEAFKHKPPAANSNSHDAASLDASPQDSFGEFRSPKSREGIVIDLWDGGSRSSRSSGHSMRSGDDMLSNTSSQRLTKDDENERGSSTMTSMREPDHLSSLSQDMENAGLDDQLYKDLRHAVTEAKNLTREAHEESMRRLKTERDLQEAYRKVKAIEEMCNTERRLRQEIEERLSNEKRILEELRKQRDDMLQGLQKAHEQRATMEKQIDDSKHAIKDFEKKLSEAHYLLISLQSENMELRKERDNAIEEVEQLHQKLKEMGTSSTDAESFMQFSYAELEEATNKFDNSLKIGEGGYGSVYKGLLGEKTMAIKMLNSEGMQGQNEFHKEVNVLIKLRHPNLVNLIGVCPEAWALVYEYLPNGSLEDRLTCKDNTPPLTWQARTRIAAEICSALNFLHSNKRLSVVHGDLKPANILLDGNFISKLGDFGICRLIQSTNNATTLYRCTHAMGTFVYMDPEFLASGDLTPVSDVYSFGIILLRLLTGRSAFGINRLVQEAVNKGSLRDIIDSAAGDWPYSQAEKLAHLGLKCSEITRKSRPDAAEAFKVLEPLAKSASSINLPPLSRFASV